MSILYGSTETDHIPLSVLVNVDVLPVLTRNLNSGKARRLDWASLTKEEIMEYYARTDQSLRNIYLPRDAVLCNDVHCCNVEHGKAICSVYKSKIIVRGQ